MAGLKAEGVILRKYLLRETSYILKIFTREYGKIKGVIKGVKKGEDVGTSLLYERQVKEIRAKFIPRKVTRKMLAKEYGVSEATIKDIVTRKSWKHL